MQETWLRALVAVDAGRLLGSDGLRRWLFGIAQNVLYESVRHARLERAPRGLGTSTADGLAEQMDTVTSVCSRLARDETLQHFLRFATSLDELERQILVSCAFEGVSISDVARRQGVAPDTAIKRWQRLRDRLRASSFDARLGLSAG